MGDFCWLATTYRTLEVRPFLDFPSWQALGPYGNPYKSPQAGGGTEELTKMARTWKALPVGDSGIALKAPTFKDHNAQLKPGWRPSRPIAEEVLVAQALAVALEDEGFRVPQGREYRLWRYPQGLAVETPQGWVVYVPLEGQVLSRAHPTDRQAEGRSFREDTEDPA